MLLEHGADPNVEVQLHWRRTQMFAGHLVIRHSPLLDPAARAVYILFRRRAGLLWDYALGRVLGTEGARRRTRGGRAPWSRAVESGPQPTYCLRFPQSPFLDVE